MGKVVIKDRKVVVCGGGAVAVQQNNTDPLNCCGETNDGECPDAPFFCALCVTAFVEIEAVGRSATYINVPVCECLLFSPCPGFEPPANAQFEHVDDGTDYTDSTVFIVELTCNDGSGGQAGYVVALLANGPGFLNTYVSAFLSTTPDSSDASSAVGMYQILSPGVTGYVFVHFCTDPPNIACCLPDGTCVEIPASDCLQQGGTLGAPTCNESECVPDQTEGACCHSDGTCEDTTKANCTGKFFPNQMCADIPCEPEVTGACCSLSGLCADNVFESDCNAFFYPNQTCADVDCSQTQACCFSFGAVCEDLPPDLCESNGGLVLPNPTCAQTPYCPGDPNELICCCTGPCDSPEVIGCSITPLSDCAGYVCGPELCV